MEIMATTERAVVIFNHSVDPFHAVMLPGLSSRDVSTAFRKYRSFSFHSKLNRPVHPDFVIIAARDIPATGHIGPGKRGMNEV